MTLPFEALRAPATELGDAGEKLRKMAAHLLDAARQIGEFSDDAKAEAAVRNNYQKAAAAVQNATRVLARMRELAPDLGHEDTPPPADAPQGGEAAERSHEKSASKTDRMSLEDFFANVGSGVIEAQKRLDRESERYLDDLHKQSGLALPSMFRVPKVSAEFQFAVEKDATLGFNVIIASNSETQRREMQQKIAFDIVSVPAPPELLDGLADRRSIAARLMSVAAAGEGAAAAALVEQIAAALILRGTGAWLVASVDAHGQLLLGIVPYDPAAAISIECLVVKEAPAAIAPMLSWVAAQVVTPPETP